VHAGPTVALGYWNNPEATSRVFRPHPLRPGTLERVVYSGDVVHADLEGFLYFVGRRDKLIKAHGYRISPEEVEEIVLRFDGALEAVACGEPDPVAGQAVTVHVVPRDPGSFDAGALLAWCRREMPSYMVPKSIKVHAAFARTPSGKIDRQQVGA
jgi:acyl-CoA synthetase (AMP-forming)/AMP-acid ligase II